MSLGCKAERGPGAPRQDQGLTRDQPPPPPAPNVTVNLILETLPLEVLERLRNQLRAARGQRAIPAEAPRAVGIGDGLTPPFRR